MTSLQSRSIAFVLRGLALNRRFGTSEGLAWLIARSRRFAPGRPPRRFGRRYAVEPRRLGGMTLWRIAPRDPSTHGRTLGGREARGHGGGPHVLYLHGGAYTFDIVPAHWRFIGRLLDEAGSTVTVPLYGLAPEHRVDEVLAQAVAAYRELLEEVPPGSIVFMGDSAGGGLVLALAQALRAEGLPQPARLVLLSPWLDLTMSNPEIDAVERLDPMLARVAAVEAGRLYAPDPADPRASPGLGPLEELPPIALFTGTHDILHPDAMRFCARARDEGRSVAAHVYPGMLHGFMLMPLPEARLARREIVEFLTGGQGQRTVGGMDDRIESTLPPVRRPNRVPRS